MLRPNPSALLLMLALASPAAAQSDAAKTAGTLTWTPGFGCAGGAALGGPGV